MASYPPAWCHSLFGPLRSHSSIPARTMVRPSRAAAVKDGPPEGLVLVWGFRSQALFTAFSISFIPVSLFDFESRFFAPTHTCRGAATHGVDCSAATQRAGWRRSLQDDFPTWPRTPIAGPSVCEAPPKFRQVAVAFPPRCRSGLSPAREGAA
jgi:hypothetical protein